jgi:hypothetical protein
MDNPKDVCHLHQPDYPCGCPIDVHRIKPRMSDVYSTGITGSFCKCPLDIIWIIPRMSAIYISRIILVDVRQMSIE